jgi:hypothetical protein
VSDGILVIGAPFDQGGSGSVYVFEKDPSNGHWSQTTKLRATDGDPFDSFGFSVGIDGNTIVVGAVSDGDKGTNSGSAYVFEKANGNWDEVSKLTANDGKDQDLFGHSVAVLGNRIVVGSPYWDFFGDPYSGSAYVFEFNIDESIWEEKFTLKSSDASDWDGFGCSVTLSEDVIVVGAPWFSHTYIFELNTFTNSWDETANLVTDSYSRFGSSVAIVEDLVIVGDENNDGGGAAYIFSKDETSTVKLFVDGGYTDQFGFSVGISQDDAVVGSPGSSHSGFYQSGSIYVYGKN